MVFGRGLEAQFGLPGEDLGDDVFNAPERSALPGPPVCTHEPTFGSPFVAGFHTVLVGGGEFVVWRGPYQK